MRAFIVEDDGDMRFILRILLERNIASLAQIGESETAEQALERIPRFCPDIVLIDISLPGIDGIELIRRLKQQPCAFRILVVTGHELNVYRQSALAAGADGIVSKADDDALLAMIQQLLKRPWC